jgi:hypothetical protein
MNLLEPDGRVGGMPQPDGRVMSVSVPGRFLMLPDSVM